MSTKTLSRPSFGKKLFERNNNVEPAMQSKVQQVNKLFAEISDIIYQVREEQSSPEVLQTQIYQHTIGQILNAQKSVETFLTMEE